MNRIHRLLVGGAMSALAASGLHAAGPLTGKYWFDSQTVYHELAPGAREIDASGLSAGVHMFSAIMEQDGKSSVASTWFYRLPPLTVENLRGSYWFDQSTERHPFNAGNFTIDTDGLSEGFHTIYAQLADEVTPYSVQTAWFIKTLGVQPGLKYTTQVFVDGNLHSTATTTAGEDGALRLDLDMNSLPVGVHFILAQVISPWGVPTALARSAFLRVPTDKQLDTLQAYYLVDGVSQGAAMPVRDGEVYTLDFDMSRLNAGLHCLSVILASPEGLATTVREAWFMKTPLGGEGVKSYDYWLNDNPATLRSKVLEKPANPFELVALLDMPQEPFTSSRYFFTMENGKPVTYAANDYQIRFYDPDGRLSMASGSYVDVRERRPVENPLEIENGSRTAVKGLADNEIRWFSFAGEPGDSLGVRLDRGAMFELYGPDGSRLMEASGAKAVDYSTMTVTEKGRYYLGVHDITARDKSQVLVDFTHIPRFALLSFTPESSSTDDLLLMDILGNGFDALETISLHGPAGAIEPDEVIKLDNQHLRLKFAFDRHEAAAGEYGLSASFTDSESGKSQLVESRRALSLEPGTEVKITTSLATVGSVTAPLKVQLTLENRSNRGVTGVPVTLAATDWDQSGTLSITDWLIHEPGTPDEESYMHTDNLLGTGKSGIYIPLVIPYMAPHEKKTMQLSIGWNPGNQLSLYALAGTPWSEELKEMKAAGDDTALDSRKDESCLFTLRDIMDIYHEAMGSDEAPADMSQVKRRAYSVTVVYDYVSTYLGSYYNSFNGTMADSYTVTYVSYGASTSYSQPQTFGHFSNNLAISPWGTIIGSWQLGGNTGKITSVRNSGHSSGTRKCRVASTTARPTTLAFTYSYDPNEMHGYEAPSGSEYVGMDVRELPYTIEFENDPELACASAQRIRVTDRIDPDVFDAASYTPGRLKIGRKEMELPALHHFVRTMDMRPEISAVAELTFDYDSLTATAVWSLRSLDPLTLDDTPFADCGILPVNDEEGSGLGFLSYSVRLKEGLAHGKEIRNSASIVFDDNDPIQTPDYMNVLDYKRPQARIAQMSTEDWRSFAFTVECTDQGAGLWFCDLYARRAGEDEWRLVLPEIEGESFVFESAEELRGADFAVVATDRAGNRQEDDFLTALAGDADGNGTVDANDVLLIVSFYKDASTPIRRANADVNQDGTIDTQDALATINIYLDGETRAMYKPKRKYQRK